LQRCRHGQSQGAAGFEPLGSGFVRVPFNNIGIARQVAAHDRSVVAGAGRADPGRRRDQYFHDEYLPICPSSCDRQNWFLMVDEVQCGLGRTGKWFSYQQRESGRRLAARQGLASGVRSGPASRAAAAQVFEPGMHGFTSAAIPSPARRAGDA